MAKDPDSSNGVKVQPIFGGIFIPFAVYLTGFDLFNVFSKISLMASLDVLCSRLP